MKLIKQDHRTVKALFRTFERADGRAQKQKIAQQIIEELSVHATIEEQLVYPVLREAEHRLEGRVLNALEEHHAAKLLLAELDKMKVDDDRFDAKMHVVRQAIETHIEEEESALLPRLEKLLDAEAGPALAEAMVAARKVVPTHPHPAAPDTPPTGMITGLIAKVIDAGKDMVRKVTSDEKAAGHRRVASRASAIARKVTRRRKVTRGAKSAAPTRAVRSAPARSRKTAGRPQRRRRRK